VGDCFIVLAKAFAWRLYILFLAAYLFYEQENATIIIKRKTIILIKFFAKINRLMA